MTVKEIVEKIKNNLGTDLSLMNITNRGVMVWPTFSDNHSVDHYRLRFEKVGNEGEVVGCDKKDVTNIYTSLSSVLDVIKTENLYVIDDKKGYSP